MGHRLFVSHRFLVEGIHILIEPSETMDEEGKFAGDQHMNHPNRLHRFPPVPGRICRHLVADLGDAFQFFLTFRVGFFRGHFPRQVGIPLAESDGSIDRNQDGFVEFFLLFYAVVVVNLVDLGQIVFYFGPDTF